MVLKFKTPFSHDEPEKFIFKCLTPSMTEQQFEFETNINNVVKGCVNSSLPPNVSQAMYDITITGDEYEKALNTKAEVLNYFEQIPVKAKEFFEYKPQKFLDFIKDDSNYEKAHELGLIDKRAYFKRKEAYLKAQEQSIQPEQVTPSADGGNS